MADVRKLKSIEEFLGFTGNSSSLNVVKIGGGWCAPCHLLDDVLQGLSNEDVEGVLLGSVDVDDEWFEDKAAELNIRGIPVTIAFKDGKETERIVGFATKDNLIEFFGRNK